MRACPCDEQVYRAYGLIISSQVACPQLPAVEGEPEVVVRYGAVPESLPEASVRATWFEASPSCFLMKVDDVARFLVRDGREIVVQPAEGGLESSIPLFLLGSVMGALLHQRKQFVLHGSSIVVGNSAAVFSGPSGVGKSTLAAAFFEKGYPVVSDDVCLVDMGGSGFPRIHPGYPQFKLWADSVEKLGGDTRGLRPLFRHKDKYGLPMGDRFWREPCPLSRMYVLETWDPDRVEVRALSGMEKVEALLQNTYRMQFLEGQGMKEQHFRQAAEVAKSLTFRQVVRPRRQFCLRELVTAIESDFRDRKSGADEVQ